jgi:hypothetical protein
MKKITKQLVIATTFVFAIVSCKKEKTSPKPSSPVVGFWTYKEDTANDYWNANVLFKNDGTFRMYQALTLADTSAAVAIADTANQVVTFGTYTVSGTTVKMTWKEFNVIDLNFSGILNSSSNNLIGNIETDQSNSASPLWYLTKP